MHEIHNMLKGVGAIDMGESAYPSYTRMKVVMVTFSWDCPNNRLKRKPHSDLTQFSDVAHVLSLLLCIPLQQRGHYNDS